MAAYRKVSVYYFRASSSAMALRYSYESLPPAGVQTLFEIVDRTGSVTIY